MIEKMIMNTGGLQEQAKDVFQEAIIIAFRKIQSGNFELQCKFSTYLYAVCKKIWLQEKRNLKKRSFMVEESVYMVEEPEYFDDHVSRLKEIIDKHFAELSSDCQKILRMHFNKVKIEEIQKVMGYESPHYAMDRKYRCKKSLIKRVINDPKFKSIKNEYS